MQNISLELKKPEEIVSDLLQNPSDPDAGYSGHKGQGYQVQVMETYRDDPDKKEKSLTIIVQLISIFLLGHQSYTSHA
jgi:hypothetical protein